MRHISIILLLFLCGCTTGNRIALERQRFLGKPSTGSLGYEGVMRGGEHYRFLAGHDKDFGHFLLTIVPQTERADVVKAALDYFAYTECDPDRFEEVVGKIKPQLLDQEIWDTGTDLFLKYRLSEWIDDIRKNVFEPVRQLADMPATDIVRPYRAFGPQVLAHELIGMAWWQWQPHGDSKNPSREYPIQVVVYWNQTLEQIKVKYPVDEVEQRDYRYVEYSAAVSYLKKTIKKIRGTKDVEFIAADLVRTLSLLQRAKQQKRFVDPLYKTENWLGGREGCLGRCMGRLD